MSDTERINRAAWSRPSTLLAFASLEGWKDPGERAALLAVAPSVRGGRVLDVGVGGGRTVSLLALLTDDYVGIDFIPAMVELCRRQHPGVDIRHGDARDLHEFADGSVALAMFSWNGIDAVDQRGRRTAIEEFHRVLRPGGHLLFSTHNRAGPAFGQSPWRSSSTQGSRLYRGARFVGQLPRNAGDYARRWPNWLRNRRFHEDHRDWAVHSSDGHDFGLIVQFTTLGRQLRELDEIGFDDTTVFASTTGLPVTAANDPRLVDHLYFLTRRAS